MFNLSTFASKSYNNSQFSDVHEYILDSRLGGREVRIERIRPISRSIKRELEKSDSCWLQYLQTMYFFTSNTFIVPFRFNFDKASQSYSIKTPVLQRFIWCVLHIVGLSVTYYRVQDGFVYVRTSTDTFRYFDFGSLIGIYFWDFACKHLFWMNVEGIQEFIDELQTSPLLRISSPRSNAVKLALAAIFFLYFMPVLFYFCLTWGMVYFNWADFHVALKDCAEKMFGVDPKMEDDTPFTYNLYIYLSLFINVHNSMILHFNDVTALLAVLLMYHIARDFSKAMLEDKLEDEDVWELIAAQKRLTQKLNRAYGRAICIYTIYCSPFYAVHIIDMFNSEGLMNRYSTGVYLIYLAMCLVAGTRINMLAKERKKWARENVRIRTMNQTRTKMFVYDLTNGTFGVGGFFSVNSRLTGEVVSLILTLAVITIQIR